MYVSVVKARQNGPLPCVNNPSFGTSQRTDVVVRTDGNDATIEDADSFGARPGLVHGAHGAMNQDNIGREGRMNGGFQD